MSKKFIYVNVDGDYEETAGAISACVVVFIIIPNF